LQKIQVMKILLLLLSTISILSFGQSTWDNVHASKEVFIKNEGQFNLRNWQSDSPIIYGLNQNPFYVFFTEKGLTYRMDKIIRNPNRDKSDPSSAKRTNVSELIHVTWLGANPNVEIKSSKPVSNTYSYAIKDFSTQKVINKSGLEGFEKLIYINIYDHIDIEYIIHPSGGIKYSFILHPGANPADIKLQYSFSNTNVANEFVQANLDNNGDLNITSSLGDIKEHKPFTYYQNSQEEIKSKYSFNNNILTFDLANYDNTESIVIDPWIVSATFMTSTAVWEVETDAAGNVYTIGGETPMELKKYNAAGALQWTYVTPWDTANVWLGTLATDDLGNSYITSGTTPEIERVDNAGVMQWHNASGGGFGSGSEYWTISFNCDKTKLIVGGTKVSGISDFYAAIFEMDITNGNVLSDQTFAYTNILGGPGATPEEVRSISSAKNGKFIYLTHNQVGSITQNFATCPVNVPGFQVNNTHNLGYKCEDYLPESQNGGGLKALVANDNFFYTHSGNEVHQWDLTTGVQITSVPLAGGGSSTVPFIGGLVVENSGLAVDDCGNVYAGSKDRVVKFDPNLNVLSTSMTTFTVYDVSVNNNGEVIAVGAQLNNSNVNRNGRIESLAMTACAQYSVICCDASFCQENPVCTTDPAFSLTPNTTGGTWSGPGVNPTTGLFDPAAAGVGTHTITYTLACGNESLDIEVNPCIALTGCEESNGDLTVTNGTGPYTWYEQGNVTTTSNDCITCGGTVFFGVCTVTTPCNITTTGWVSSGTGTTFTPTTFPVKVEDANGDTLIINSAGSLGPCSTAPTAALSASNTTLCAGDCITFTDNSTNIPAGSQLGWNFPGATPANSTAANPTNICYNTPGSYWATIIYTDAMFNVIDSTGLAITVTNCTAPVAGFTMSAGPYCTGDCITFTSTSTYSPGATFAWDFGNTQTSSVENPTAPICYAAAGSFTVTLTVTDANGTDTETQTVTIASCTTPVAGFTMSAGPYCTGDCITFTSTSTYSPGATFAWDFGNTQTSSVENPTAPICYAAAGSFTVTLTVTDANGTDTETQSVTIATCTAPNASLSVSNTALCIGDCVSFTDNSTNMPPGALLGWNFPGATPANSTAANPTNICYNTAGSYWATIIYTDAMFNVIDSTGLAITVTNCTPPVAGFTMSAGPYCTGDCVTFTSTSTYSPGATFTWDFGNTQTSSVENPTAPICYGTAGSFTVTLTVTDANGTDTETQTVAVTACTTPNAALSATSATLCVGDCIDFTDLSTNMPAGSQIGWNFPGATPANSTAANPTTICYNTAGSYWATIVYVDATFNVIDSTGIPITVNSCTAPDANIDVQTPGPYCAGDCITFGSTSAYQTPATFVWDFGNGSSSNTETPSGPICYVTAGTYTVSLTVNDVTGSNTETQTITIAACNTPTSSFTISENDLCENDCITFTNASTDATSYSWTFEGGSPATSTSQDPGTVCFGTLGTYNISLVVTNAFGSDSTATQITVAESPSIIAFGDTSIVASQTVPIGVLNPDPSLDYIWTPNVGIECTYCSETNVTPLDTMYYYITATNASGCIGIDSVYIQVEIIEGIGIPNAFSPNGDGFNDILSVQGYGITEMTFSVYNQYGQKVFEGYNQSSGWDGTFQSKPVNPGVFVYVLIYNAGGAEDLILKGNVTLVK
jgi:gliding motility-associated-like protein